MLQTSYQQTVTKSKPRVTSHAMIIVVEGQDFLLVPDGNGNYIIGKPIDTVPVYTKITEIMSICALSVKTGVN